MSSDVNMMIRELTPVDAATYQALMLHGLVEHAESFRISIQDDGEPMVPFALSRTDAFTLGAWLAGGQLVGVASFERETRVKFRHKGLLYRMYVSADAAGRGIGRKLIQEIVRRARQIEGLEQINLTVVASNSKAMRLYSSEGFKSFALEKNGLKTDKSYSDEEQMALFLPKENAQQCAPGDA